jgi:hypothetical protein
VPDVPGLIEEYERVGGVVSTVTTLSDVVEAEFWLPNASVTVRAAIDGAMVPPRVMVVYLRFHVMLSVVVRAADPENPVAVPPWVILPVVSDVTAAENTIVNSTGAPALTVLTGSAWPTFWLIVTDRAAGE